MRASAWYTRPSVERFVESAVVQRFVITVIIANAVILGMETSETLMTRWGETLTILDHICLGIFIVEIALKLYARAWRFFGSAWNVFDFMVVAIALVPGAGPLAVLRSLRVLRVLRLVSTIPSLRRVVDGLVKAVPGIGAIAALLLIVFYVSAVVATKLFGAAFPSEYGTLGRSLFSLFQVMTLDNWSVMVRDIIEEYSWAPAFFVPFILLSAMTVLNLLVAVIIDAMAGLQRQPRESATTSASELVLDTLDEPTRQALSRAANEGTVTIVLSYPNEGGKVTTSVLDGRELIGR